MTPYGELCDRVQKTSGVRFISARRLQHHLRLSQWVLTLAAVGLILFPLLELAGSHYYFSFTAIKIIEVALATTVMAFTLLVGQEEYAVQYDRLIRCCHELLTLARELEPLIKNEASPEDTTYLKFVHRYDDILNISESQIYIDYLRFRLRHPDRYPMTWRERTQTTVEWLVRGIAGYVHYFALLGLMVALFLKELRIL